MKNTKTPIYSWYALGLLTLVYVMNFLDRTVMFFLFTPIKAEFGLPDFQLILIGSTAFVIFYTVLGIPCGRIADKKIA
jgi:MFS family permease